MLNSNLSVIPHSRPWISVEDIKSVNQIFKTKMISSGDLVNQIEKKISKYYSIKYSFSLSSGTSAIIASLIALNIKPGDGIILPTYVCKDVLEAVLSVGAKAQLCDVNSNGVISEQTVKKVFNKKTKAIIAVHTFGNSCDIKSLFKFSVPIIEDICQAFGLKVKGEKPRIIGDFGILSFNATKCLTTGEGGMVLVNKFIYAQKINKIFKNKNYNFNTKFKHFDKISDIQAALGISQLKRYEKFIKKRQNLFKKFYLVTKKKSIHLVNDYKSNIKFRFVIKKKNGYKFLKNFFLTQNIIVRKGIDQLLHRILNLNDKKFKNAVELFNSSISIPFYPSLSKSEISRILKLLIKI